MDEPGGRLSRRARGLAGARRGQSELVGVVLFTFLVILGSVLVGVLGGAALAANEKAVAVAHAEQSFTQLDARTSDVALGFDRRSTQTVALGLQDDHGGVTTNEDSWLRISFLNTSSGVTDVTVVNQSLGTVVYRRDGTTVAYEGGGVWRSDGAGSAMVSPPEFHYRNGTLTIPVVSMSGDSAPSRRVSVERNGTPTRVYPDATRGLTNRVDGVKVTVTVHSDYYRAWGRYFARSTRSLVWYDDGNETATVAFLALPEQFYIRNGIVATAGTGRIELHGSGAYTDSYDSRNGTYAATKSGDGTVQAVGDVSMWGNSTINGNLESGGHVNFSGGPSVFGDIGWSKPPEPNATDVNGETSIAQIDGVATIEPLDGYVYDVVDRIRATNNNSQAGDLISSGSIVVGPGKGKSHVLTSGRYYVDRVEVDQGKLVLDTSGGDIYLAVRDWLSVTNGGHIAVEGNGTVHLFVAGRNELAISGTGIGNREVNLYLGKGANVTTPGQRAAQLQLFAPQDFRAVVAANNGQPVAFDGLVYAPAGLYGDGYVYVKQGDLYGGIVTGSLTLGQYGAVHYDEALSEVALPRSPNVARLRYLHVSVHRVRVESV